MLQTLKSQAVDDIAKLERDDLEHRYFANIRYLGQGSELRVAVAMAADGLPDVTATRQNFAEAYRQTYGYDEGDAPIEATDWHLTVTRDSRTVATAPGQTAVAAAPTIRKAYFPECGGFVDTAVHKRLSMRPGQRVDGPAIIEEAESTTILPPGTSASLSAHGNLVIDIEMEA
jgi:N-methylhydantoinase A